MTYRGGRTGAPGDSLLAWLLIVLVVGVPNVFYRKVFFTFQIPQLTLFWIAASAALLVGVYRVLVAGVLYRSPRPLALASVAFTVSLVGSTLLSSQQWAAFSGLAARGAGAFSYLLGLGILHTVYGLARRRSPEPLVWAMITANLLVATYALLQAFGLDPVDWAGSDAYVGNLVFSTLGNANFSAGFVGLTLPVVAWVPFGSRRPVTWRVVGGAALGVSALALVHLNSFQGNVAGGAAVVVLALWATQRDRSERLIAFLIAAPVAATVASSALVAHTSGPLMLFPFLIVPVSCAYAGVRWDNRDPSSRTVARSPLTWGPRVGCALLVLTVGVSARFFSGRLIVEASDGLDQRIEYWKASLSIFRTSPIVGTGLETYQNYFAAHRSAEQATEWEMLVSNTPHSVLLSVLGGGGILLSVGYMAVIGVVGYYGIRAVQRSEGHDRLFHGAVLAAWVAYQVQASVSTDVPGLLAIQWVLGGILVAGGAHATPSVRVLPWQAGWAGRGNASDISRRFAAVALVGVFIISVPSLTAPIRANMAAFRGQQALNVGDVDTAEQEFLRAAELQPRDGFYAERVAVVYEGRGLNGLAFEEREKIARLQFGDPYAAVRAARAAIRLNRLDVAEYWYDRAVPNDPYGATVLTTAADFYAKTGSEGRALELLSTFEALDSTNLGAWQIASEVYAHLGNEAAAGHAGICGTPGQVGC